MTSTPTEPGPFDALEKARPDEPIFPLLARDPDAPATITEWARLRRNRAIKLYGDKPKGRERKLQKAEFRQCAEAEQVAMDMVEWRKGEVDEPGARASYQDVQKSEAEIAAANARSRREEAIRHLREGAYHLNEAREILVDMQLVGDLTASDMQQMVARIIGIDDAVVEVRPGIEPTLELPVPEGQPA